eukprot:gene15547-11127_t
MDSKAAYYVADDSKSLSASSSGDDDKYSPRAGDDDSSSPRIISLLEDDELGSSSRSRGSSSDYYRSSYDATTDAKATRSGHGRLSSAATTAAMTLDLSGFHRADGKKAHGGGGGGGVVGGGSGLGTDSKDEYLEPAIQEKDVLVVFDLPDGSQGEKTFKYGHTVELLKSFVEGEYGIPMTEQSLYLDDRKLDNPFSLLDYPEVKGCEEIFIRVEGNLPQFSKK